MFHHPFRDYLIELKEAIIIDVNQGDTRKNIILKRTGECIKLDKNITCSTPKRSDSGMEEVTLNVPFTALNYDILQVSPRNESVRLINSSEGYESHNRTHIVVKFRSDSIEKLGILVTDYVSNLQSVVLELNEQLRNHNDKVIEFIDTQLEKKSIRDLEIKKFFEQIPAKPLR